MQTVTVPLIIGDRPATSEDWLSIRDTVARYPDPVVISRDEADQLYASYVEGLKPKKVYLIGSLRNNAVPELGKRLRRSVPNYEVFDDWYAAGPEADDFWKEYEQGRGRAYTDALSGHAAKHVFEFDKHHLDTSTHAVLVLPAGKSGHMELMYAAYGVGAKCAILLEQGADPRWDVMYQFIDNVFETTEQLEEWLRNG
jgi:hypothetical protein